MQIQCPQCKSFNTKSDRAVTAVVGLVSLVGGGLFSFLIFPLVFCALGILMLLVAAFSKPKKMQCQNCKYKWKI